MRKKSRSQEFKSLGNLENIFCYAWKWFWNKTSSILFYKYKYFRPTKPLVKKPLETKVDIWYVCVYFVKIWERWAATSSLSKTSYLLYFKLWYATRTINFVKVEKFIKKNILSIILINNLFSWKSLNQPSEVCRIKIRRGTSTELISYSWSR